jgi:hypothetical protein
VADCFWTDFVGCVEDCGGTPVLPTGNAAAQAWPSSVDSTTVFDVVLGTDVCTVTQNGNMGVGSSGVATAVIKRAEVTFDDADSGCGQIVGAAPDWWPADVVCGAWHCATPAGVLSGDNLNIALHPKNDGNGGFDLTWGELLTSLGLDIGTGFVQSCVVNLEIVGSDGIAYYASMLMNYCY